MLPTFMRQDGCVSWSVVKHMQVSPLYDKHKLKSSPRRNLYQSAVRKACIDKKLQLTICTFYEQANCVHSLTIQIETK